MPYADKKPIIFVCRCPDGRYRNVRVFKSTYARYGMPVPGSIRIAFNDTVYAVSGTIHEETNEHRFEPSGKNAWIFN